jgi:hypothetical protein
MPMAAKKALSLNHGKPFGSTAPVD